MGFASYYNAFRLLSRVKPSNTGKEERPFSFRPLSNVTASSRSHICIPYGPQDISIGKYAFAGSTEPAYIYLPANVSHIESNVFYNTDCVIITPENSYAQKWAVRNNMAYRTNTQ